MFSKSYRFIRAAVLMLDEVFELLTGRWLFNPRSGPTFTEEQYHLAHMGPVVGETFDPTFVRSGKYSSQYIKEDGEFSGVSNQSLMLTHRPEQELL